MNLLSLFDKNAFPGQPVYVIAEIGSNHGGNLDTALQYIDAFAGVGANAIKFQSWKTETLQNPIDVDNGESLSVVGILKKYELPVEWHRKLKERCDEKGVDFLSTPFDPERARLIRDIGCRAIKIASGDLTYTQLLEEISGYGLPVLLSTGMAEIEEIRAALAALGVAASRTVLLHCIGAYPPATEDANLLAIKTLAGDFGVPVGFSDHYPGSAMSLAAVALGARVIEKHVAFSRQAGHPDSPFAMELNEFAAMVTQIRLLEKALGDGKKTCRFSEQGGRVGGRRSLYWVKDLAVGVTVAAEHLAALRPAKGELPPAALRGLCGKTLVHDVKAGSPVRMNDFANE